MKYRIIAWAVSTMILGLLIAGGMHLTHVQRIKLGRDAFMAKEADRYDHIFSRPDHFIAEAIFGMIMAGALFGVYELAAFGIGWTVERWDGENKG